MKTNKVVQINLMGGLLGLIFTNPRRALERRIHDENVDGWNCTYFVPHQDTNILVTILKIAVLILTLFLFTWGAGYMVLFEKDVTTPAGDNERRTVSPARTVHGLFERVSGSPFSG